MKMRFLLPVLCLAVLCLTTPSLARASDLVANGSFDLNSPPPEAAPLDWTLVPAAGGSDFDVEPGPGYGAFSAPNSANFGAVGSEDDELYQILSTVPGDSYTLSFYLAHASTDSANDFSASWNGTDVLSLVDASAFGYTEYSYTVTATSSSTTLAFSGGEVPSWYDLDNVSVTGQAGSAVPEPSSLLLLGSGLAGLAGLARRKLRALRLKA